MDPSPSGERAGLRSGFAGPGLGTVRRYGARHSFGARVDDGWTYRGLRTVVIENEVLRATVLADKGADVCSLVHKPTDTEYLWRSPAGIRAAAESVPSTGGDRALWLDSYEGGWQSVFPNGGDPSDLSGAPLGLHGESSTLPWDVSLLEEGPDRAVVRFTVELARTPIRAQRNLSVIAGSPTLAVDETITNRGSVPLPISYGQHITLGSPFLSETCLIDLPGGVVRSHPVRWSPDNRLKPGTERPWPWAQLADGSPVDLRRIPPPGAGWEDQVYIDEVPDGWYAVTNLDLGVGLAVRYPHNLYRHLWYWQVFSGGRYPWWGRAYTVGLEPFTAATNCGVDVAVADGSALVLAPGASAESSVRMTAFRSWRGVRSVDRDGGIKTQR